MRTNSNLNKISIFIAVFIGMLCTNQNVEGDYRFGYRRHYYTSWTYRPATSYYYSRYYYRPTTYTRTYSYHYVIRFRSQPRYYYYYNPVRRTYWGRFEFDENGKALGYSLLKKEDRKSSLDDIPESAFPKPSKMPQIPGSADGVQMIPPPPVTE